MIIETETINARTICTLTILFPSSLFLASFVLYVNISGKIIPPSGITSPNKAERLISLARSTLRTSSF